MQIFPALKFQSALIFLCVALSGGAVQAQTNFAQWRDALWTEARAFGITRATFDTAFRGLTPNYKLPDLDLPGRNKTPNRGQAEFTKPPQAYVSERYIAQLAQKGRRLAKKYHDVLRQIEKEIGVRASVVLAIWGRETAYGGYKLRHDAIRALATQAYAGRRKDMFRKELLFALKMLQAGVVKRSEFRGSWAGAVGLTQFMPSEYFQLAYDLNRDGRADIWSPAEALASAANQLRMKGWRTNEPWGFEVVLPANVSCAEDGPDKSQPIANWAARGVRRVAKRAFPQRLMNQPGFLFSPGGGVGPEFLAMENFLVFKRYNTSDLYALFVGHLADRIAGGGGFVTSWGALKQLPTREILEMQRHLKSRGYGIGKLDGKIGPNTRSQIGQYQKRNKLKVTCWPTAALLRAMHTKGGN